VLTTENNMKIKKIQTLLILILSLLLMNCLSSSSYKTANALGKTPSGKGQVQMITAVNYFPWIDEYSGAATSSLARLLSYQPELILRFALAPEKVDFGIKTSSTYIAADLKVQFLRGPISMALDLEGVYSFLNVLDTGISYYQVNPGLLITVAVSPAFSFTLAPKILHNIITAELYRGFSTSYSYTMYGGALTLDIGKEYALMPEVTFYHDPISGQNLTSFGIGFRFGGHVQHRKRGKSVEEPGSDLDDLSN